MASKVAKRPIRRKAAGKKVTTPQSPAGAISAAYEHAERFIEAQRHLLRGLIDSLGEQFTQRAHRRLIPVKATHARRPAARHVAARRPAKHSA